MDNKDSTLDDTSLPDVDFGHTNDIEKEEDSECSNKEKPFLNQKHNFIFKAYWSPISSRLRNKKRINLVKKLIVH